MGGSDETRGGEQASAEEEYMNPYLLFLVGGVFFALLVWR